MDDMNPDELREAFAIIRQHSSPLVWPLIDSLERMVDLDRQFIDSTRVQVALLDGILRTRLAAVERADDPQQAGPLRSFPRNGT